MTPRPLCPTSDAWVAHGPQPPFGSLAFTHALSGLTVFSNVEPTDRGPEWHLSVSIQGRRAPTFAEAAFALQSFGAENFERDDHGTRVTANYWKPVNRDMEGVCPCKEEGEPAPIHVPFRFRGKPGEAAP